MEKIILTRKIQILLDEQNPELRKEAYAKLNAWQWTCFRSANFIFTHHFLQDQIKELIYITDETKIKLSDIKKDEDGILTTSKANTTYQLLSKYFKGDIPMEIISCLNHSLVSNYNTERQSYWKGEKTLRNYKRDLPIPFKATSLKLTTINSSKNFQFKLFGIPFKTYLGKDHSDKYQILKKVMAGIFKISASSIKMEQGKIFLLLACQLDRDIHPLDPGVIAEASLSLEHPISVKIGNENHLIGNKEEFLHQRIAIQNARRRLQKAAPYIKSGKGRKRKLKPVTEYGDYEQRYINSKLHLYSKMLIDMCIKNQAATLVLTNQEQKEDIAKTDEFLLRNWSYYGLKEKIVYKAKKAGITLITE